MLFLYTNKEDEERRKSSLFLTDDSSNSVDRKKPGTKELVADKETKKEIRKKRGKRGRQKSQTLGRAQGDGKAARLDKLRP